MRKAWVWGLALSLLLGACTAGEADDSATTFVVAIEDTTTTTTTPATTTTVATTSVATSTTMTEVEDDGLIGTQAAYDELVEQVLEDVRFRADEPDLARDDVPLPELRVADPVEALEEILAFDAWAYSSIPVPGWADLWSERGRPYWADTARPLETLTIGRLRVNYLQDGWTLLDIFGIGDAASVGEFDLEGSDLPGAAIVGFETQLADYELVGWDTDEVVSLEDGWRKRGAAVLVPTEAGWIVHDLAAVDV